MSGFILKKFSSLSCLVCHIKFSISLNTFYLINNIFLSSIHSFTHPVIHSFIHLFIHSFFTIIFRFTNLTHYFKQNFRFAFKLLIKKMRNFLLHQVNLNVSVCLPFTLSFSSCPQSIQNLTLFSLVLDALDVIHLSVDHQVTL